MAAVLPKLVFRKLIRCSIWYQARYASEECSNRKGLVLGVFYDPECKEHKFTPSGLKFNNQVGGRLEELIKDGPPVTEGTTQVYQNLDPEFNSIAVAGLGPPNSGYNPLENLDECKEYVRMASAAGARQLQKKGALHIMIDAMGSAEAAAEGAALGLWRFQECLSPERKKTIPMIDLYESEEKDEWERGIFKAEAQNIARRLTDSPANLMTPPVFAQNAVDLLCPCGVGVEVYDKDWAEFNKFRLFLHVAKGSCEPPVVLKLNYCGGMPEEKPIVFVGSGVTFDSGGLCLKKCKGLAKFRADMSGAAVIVALFRAVAILSLPINVMAVIPLCENVPSGMAMKAGDIIRSMNEKSVVVDDTDNEGRLLIADGLAFATMHLTPRMVIDVGTLTEGMVSAIGAAATGVYTNNNQLWKEMSKAGAITGDRVWRFPLWKFFTKKVANIRNADLTNKGFGPGGGPCRAAAFLKEFVDCGEWVHCDTAGSGMLTETEDVPYLPLDRMSGRPVRMLLQFLYQLACPGKSDS